MRTSTKPQPAMRRWRPACRRTTAAFGEGVCVARERPFWERLASTTMADDVLAGSTP